MYYYMRNTKTGDYLITSYANQQMAARVAGMEKTKTNSSLWEGEMNLNLTTGKFGARESGVGLRSFMETQNPVAMSGRYSVWALPKGEHPVDLGVRFASMGDANAFMKAMIGTYGRLAVVEDDTVREGGTSEKNDVTILTEAPF